MDVWPPSFSVSGRHVSVVELSRAHETDLVEAAADGDLHRLWYTTVPKPEDVGVEIDRRRSLRDSGSMLPFAIVDLNTAFARRSA